jgi:small subunit ribosomal protein S8
MNKINITNDLLVALKNGYSNKNKYAHCRINKFCLDILWILYKEGLIADFKIQPDINKIKIKLKYIKSRPLLTNIKLISKPGFKRFVNFNDLNYFYDKFDYFFLSTSSGVVSSKILLKNLKIGGQILFGFKINN